MDICTDVNFLKVMNVIVKLVDFLRVLVPLIIIVPVTKDLYEVVIKGNDAEMKAQIKIVMKRVLIGLIIVFSPIILKIVVGWFDKSIVACIFEPNIAQVETDNLIAANEALATYALDPTDENYEKAKIAINKLTNSEEKTELYNKLNEIRTGQKPKTTTTKKDDNIPQYLNVEPGIHKKSYSKNDIKVYYEVIPNNPKTNMPLVIYMHGKGAIGGNLENTPGEPIVNYVNNGYSGQPFILVAPVLSSGYSSWATSTSSVKELIDTISNEYQIDKSRIMLTGFSLGAMGAWNMINNYPTLFKSAVIISGCAYSVEPSNFTNTAIYAMCGNGDEYELQMKGCMPYFTNKVSQAGGNITFEQKTSCNGKSCNHSAMGNQFAQPYVYEWLLKQ